MVCHSYHFCTAGEADQRLTAKSRCNLFFFLNRNLFISHPFFVFQSDVLRLTEAKLWNYRCALCDFPFLSLPDLNISCVDLLAYDVFVLFMA